MDDIEKQIYKYSENDMDTLRAMLNGSHKANKFLQALADKRLELLKEINEHHLTFGECLFCTMLEIEEGYEHDPDCELAEAIDG